MSGAPKPPKRSVNSWVRTYQSTWGEKASDHTNYPDWFRVWSLAIARSTANGHATFSPGEIARILGCPGPEGIWVPKPGSGVSQAVSLAKRKGLIDESSNARCLVLPAHAWQGGLGSPSRRCSVHG